MSNCQGECGEDQQVHYAEKQLVGQQRKVELCNLAFIRQHATQTTRDHDEEKAPLPFWTTDTLLDAKNPPEHMVYYSLQNHYKILLNVLQDQEINNY